MCVNIQRYFNDVCMFNNVGDMYNIKCVCVYLIKDHTGYPGRVHNFNWRSTPPCKRPIKQKSLFRVTLVKKNGR